MKEEHRAPPVMVFSLIELLITIAIIAILSAILFPALNKAKGAAVRAACLSNIRQAYLGVANYAADSNGLAPYYKPWTTTAALAVTSVTHSLAAFGAQTAGQVYFRGLQMVDNQYWDPGIIRCPARPDWWVRPSTGIVYCFDTKGYYRKKAITYEGVNSALYISYPMKGCAISLWAGGAVNDPAANLSYRLGQEPGEPVMIEWFTDPYIWHGGRISVAYEDGGCANVKIPLTSAALGSADTFMQIVFKTTR